MARPREGNGRSNVGKSRTGGRSACRPPQHHPPGSRVLAPRPPGPRPRLTPSSSPPWRHRPGNAHDPVTGSTGPPLGAHGPHLRRDHLRVVEHLRLHRLPVAQRPRRRQASPTPPSWAEPEGWPPGSDGVAGPTNRRLPSSNRLPWCQQALRRPVAARVPAAPQSLLPPSVRHEVPRLRHGSGAPASQVAANGRPGTCGCPSSPQHPALVSPSAAPTPARVSRIERRLFNTGHRSGPPSPPTPPGTGRRGPGTEFVMEPSHGRADLRQQSHGPAGGPDLPAAPAPQAHRRFGGGTGGGGLALPVAARTDPAVGGRRPHPHRQGAAGPGGGDDHRLGDDRARVRAGPLQPHRHAPPAHPGEAGRRAGEGPAHRRAGPQRRPPRGGETRGGPGPQAQPPHPAGAGRAPED